MAKIRHPAKYTDGLLPVLSDAIGDARLVLDPFGGTGKLREIAPDAVCMDIEREWAVLCGLTADALHLPFADDTFDTICTSPTYGNRMADTYTDGTHRITYTNYLGRKLSNNNSGQMQWGSKYKDFHVRAWMECLRVLRSGGKFIINTKNHIRAGNLIDVTRWHSETLLRLGAQHYNTVQVNVPSNRFGQNGEKRAEYETVDVFVSGKPLSGKN